MTGGRIFWRCVVSDVLPSSLVRADSALFLSGMRGGGRVGLESQGGAIRISRPLLVKLLRDKAIPPPHGGDASADFAQRFIGLQRGAKPRPAGCHRAYEQGSRRSGSLRPGVAANIVIAGAQAVLDACVLVDAALRDTLLRIAEPPCLCLPRWSTNIMKEITRTANRRLPQ